jgi:hypothetical protein
MGNSASFDAIQTYLDLPQLTYPSTRILTSLGDRIKDYVIMPSHPGAADHPSELIATSMHLSDFDVASQNLIREIFSLPPGFDKEFIST